MAQYLCASDIKMSIDEKKWLYKWRIEDIDFEANRRWKNGDINCINCKSNEMNQRHLLICKYLIGKSEIVTYIPDYNDLFKEDIEEQLYIYADYWKTILPEWTLRRPSELGVITHVLLWHL